MKIKYKIKDTINGVEVNSKIQSGSDIWERRVSGWYCLSKDSQYFLQSHPYSNIIDDNYKNGSCYTIIKS